MSRVMTESEVRTALLEHVHMMVDYWDAIPEERLCGDEHQSARRKRLEGLAFSILSALDGSSVNLPKFVVAPDPHPEDRDYHRSENADWYPENHDVGVRCDIGGTLHEHFYKACPYSGA